MVTFNVDSLDFEDDEEARFGSNTDYATRFDSANSRLELADLTNGTTGFVPQDVGTDLVGGKYAQTVAEGKALADDGDVYDSIQTAVNNASSYVKVGPGEFRESVTIDTAGLTLQGSGDRTMINGGSEMALFLNASNLHLSSFSVKSPEDHGIRENPDSTAISNITCENIRVITSEFNGISLDYGNNHKVINCRIESSDTHGVVIPTGGIVKNCTIKNISRVGIFENNSDQIVVGNIVKRCGEEGIRVTSDDSLCGANRVDNIEQIGIVVKNDDNIVFNNRISNTGSSGVEDNGSGTVLDSNIIT